MYVRTKTLIYFGNFFAFFLFKLQDLNDSNGYDAARMSYPVYMLPDSAQQYVSMPAENVQTDPINGESSNAIPSYVESSPELYPYGGYSGIVPYVNGNIGGGYNPGAFAVQSGYDGYLLPVQPKAVKEKAKSNTELPFISTISNAITSLTSSLPTSMRATGAFGTQAAAAITAFLSFVLLGGGLTTAVCTLTPWCTITFSLPFLRNGFRTIAEPLLGADNTEMLDSAFERLSKGKMARKSTDKGNDVGADAATATADIIPKALNATDRSKDVETTIANVNQVMKAAQAQAAVAATSVDKSIDKTSNDK